MMSWMSIALLFSEGEFSSMKAAVLFTDADAGDVEEHHSHKPSLSDSSVCAPVVGFDDVIPVQWGACQSARRK